MCFAGQFYILLFQFNGVRRPRKTQKRDTCLGIGRGDPDAIRILDDVLAKRAVKKKSTWSERVVPFGEREKDASRTIELHRCNYRGARGALGGADARP